MPKRPEKDVWQYNLGFIEKGVNTLGKKNLYQQMIRYIFVAKSHRIVTLKG